MIRISCCVLLTFGIALVYGMPPVRFENSGESERHTSDIDELENQLEEIVENLRQRRGNYFRFGKRRSLPNRRLMESLLQ
ncbi:unnamed protein product [Hymenolepis diminuta]|uniref:Uncharacterized protein n=1 Tax=Hymenolepis diminuta TaxID=6216 RepID=A0A564Z0R0_HYMDI|nr:unnamed protein product [Hymenolepis diminuta]